MKKWPKYHKKCIECGCDSTERSYGANGLCGRCWQRFLYKNKEHHDRILANAIISKKRKMFGEGNWDLVMTRSDGKCVICGSPATDVDHMDNDGWGSVSYLDRWIGNIGNDPDRQQALCKSCHAKVTNERALKIRRLGWSCIKCGRNDVPYYAKGCCKRCYERMQTEMRKLGF